jgi:type IV pilus assembly protein PilY1
MNLFFKPIRAALRLPFLNKFWSALLIVLLAGTGTFVAFSQSGPPNIKAITLAQDPLYGAVVVDKPTLTLALSVEEPTVGALHLGTVYSNGNEYLGYWDAKSCYQYNKAPTEVAATAPNYTDYKRFYRMGDASDRKCADAFSGNFLNFAASSAIDMIRLALSGGDRLIDTGSSTDSLTILQRAVLPNGGNDGDRDTPCFFNAALSFPAKSIPKDGGNYLGAVPLLMRTAAGGGADIVVANTLNQIFFGVSTSAISPAPPAGTCGNTALYDLAASSKSNLAGGTDNFFYARVQVCDADASKVLKDARDYSFCSRQPNGFYKPTGSIQRYSDQMRLAAFGYLMDRRFNGGYSVRYGGVLRAPMKYVGAKTFNETGIDNTPIGGNAKREWNANTGVFIDNPDSDATQTPPISGVINYLNKFGRTGTIAGRYKSADPVGELYGEALRYLQGLGPTPDAISDVTASMYDGFPVFTTWADPYGGDRSKDSNYACLKTNIAVVGDVNTWDSGRYLGSRTANLAENLPKFSEWLNLVTYFEANATTKFYTDPNGGRRYVSNPNTPNGLTLTSDTGVPSVLVGQAYWAHSQDIRGRAWTGQSSLQSSLQRPGLRVKSYFFDVNEGGNSTKVAGGDNALLNGKTPNKYRKYQNQFFMAAKYGGYETDPDNALQAAYNTFGNPFKRDDGTNDNNVWQDPANPGEASTYYLASDARATLRAFDSIFRSAVTASRSIAKSAVSNKTLSPSGSLIYQGVFDSFDWNGDVLAIPLTLTGTSTVSIGSTPTWTAASQLSARSEASRNIVIGRTGTAVIPASEFRWASLDDGMKAHLNKLTPSSTADALGEDRVKYLRGDTSKEGTPFRARSKVLGDIVNSGIVYSGTPTLNITPSTAAYQSFYDLNKNRTAAIFVGANDGMLHAFNAATGNELFGYIPSWMGPKLAALTDASYNTNHQAYVDATPAVAEAQVGTDWKTVLVGGTGAGGPGVYALDVTNPAAFSASKVLWEFTKNDDADMGYVVGSPKIIKVRTSASGAPAAYRWFAVVASGVNNYLPYPDASGTYSTTGNPALFFLDLNKPAGTAWASGTNYYKLSVPFQATLSANNATGLINFQAILGPVGELAQIYMGDLHGNVWKLDFATRDISTSSFYLLSYYKYNNAAYPMYIAKTAADAVQPITMAPLVASAPPSGGLRTSYIAFGTGKYLEASDKTSTAQNSFYTLYDDGTPSATAGGASIPGRGRLITGTVTTGTVTSTVSVPSFKWGRPTTDTDTTKRSGWYFDYASNREKSISGANIVGDQLFFGSLITPAPETSGSCTAGGGGGNDYKVNIDNGNGTFSASAVGLFGEVLAFDIPSAKVVTVSTSTGRRMTTVTTTTVKVGAKGVQSSSTPTSTTFVSGRLSWRQINNYQDLKNAQ